MLSRCGFNLSAFLALVLVGMTMASARQPAKSLTNSIGLELALIPAGEFDIGTPDSAKYNHWPSEKPQHRVKITKAFYFGKFEVTQEQYEKVTGKNPSYFASTGAYKDKVKDLDTRQFPVEGVTWEDAQAFCVKLSNLEAEKKAGRVYRLPTSAEWEYACRAGTTTLFYSGAKVWFKEANFGDGGGRPDVGLFGHGDDKDKPPGRTTKVGSYAPNPWGLYDMHGNVVEWCQDYFDPDYYQLKVKEDPQGPKIGSAFAPQARVVRGGSWWTRTNYNRSACRHPSGQVGGPGRIGFRVVCVTVGTR